MSKGHHTSEKYKVCWDCYEYLIVDQDSPDIPDDLATIIEERAEEEAQKLVEFYTSQPYTHRHFSDDNDKDEFSWTPCELCQNSLGGERYTITLNVFFGGDKDEE